MRISDWSSDVCSSDLLGGEGQGVADAVEPAHAAFSFAPWIASARVRVKASSGAAAASPCPAMISTSAEPTTTPSRSEEHTSEPQSLMRISYAVFCLKKKKNKQCTRIHKNNQHDARQHITKT